MRGVGRTDLVLLALLGAGLVPALTLFVSDDDSTSAVAGYAFYAVIFLAVALGAREHAVESSLVTLGVTTSVWLYGYAAEPVGWDEFWWANVPALALYPLLAAWVSSAIARVVRRRRRG